MPATNFPECAREIQDVLDASVAAGEAVLVSIQVDQRSSLRGFIAGLLQFNDAAPGIGCTVVSTTMASHAASSTRLPPPKIPWVP